ncbi:MAG: 4Fe-4S binding protein [Candidatus Helarchaeota archaeon]
MFLEIKIDLDKCIGCKTCVENCFYGVLEWFEDQPIVVNPNGCGRCFVCQKNCPVGAIKIIER